MNVGERDLEVEMRELNYPLVDFFILSDYAEAVNGKLYLMGGGWDRVFVQDFQKPVTISFAVGLLVPWNATNIRHTVQITIEDHDRKQPTGFSVDASFVTGRPPLITEGESQRTILALPGVPITFEGPGAYQAVARIVGGVEKRVGFRLVALPTIQVQRHQGAE